MSHPEKYDHEIYAGEDYFFDLTFRGEDTLPINLTGFVVTCQIFDVLQHVRATAEVTIPDVAAGKVFFKFRDEETRFLRETLHCSVKAFGATGNIQFAIDGDAKIYQADKLPLPVPIPGTLVGLLPLASGVVNG